MLRSFLDAASGQPLHPAATQALVGFAERSWADPHQSHHEGRLAQQLLGAARETAAAVVGVRPSELFFRTAGLDAASQAIEGLLLGKRRAFGSASYPQGNVTVLSSAVERAAVFRATELAGEPGQVRLIPVDNLGRVDLSALEATTSERSVLVLQSANVELGTVQPLVEARSILGEDGYLATDATGTLGWQGVPPVWNTLFADAHSWAGPRGIGVVAISEGTPWRNPADDSSTTPVDIDDLANAIAAAAALDAVHRESAAEALRLSALVDKIRHKVATSVLDVEILGDPTNRLPHTVTFSCLYADGERLALILDRMGIAIGSGSACAARPGLPSHVLTAIGALTHGNVRVSLPWGCSTESVDNLLAALPAAVAEVRADAGAP